MMKTNEKKALNVVDRKYEKNYKKRLTYNSDCNCDDIYNIKLHIKPELMCNTPEISENIFLNSDSNRFEKLYDKNNDKVGIVEYTKRESYERLKINLIDNSYLDNEIDSELDFIITNDHGKVLYFSQGVINNEYIYVGNNLEIFDEGFIYVIYERLMKEKENVVISSKGNGKKTSYYCLKTISGYWEMYNLRLIVLNKISNYFHGGSIFKELFTNCSGMMIVYSVDDEQIVAVNPSFEKNTGYSQNEINDVSFIVDRMGETINFSYLIEEKLIEKEILIVKKDNKYINCLINGVLIDDNLFYCYIINLNKFEQNQIKFQNLSIQDYLGNFYNKKYFDYKIGKLRETEENVCVLVIDIDGLREINDKYGYETGDDIIIVVGERLSSIFNDVNVYRIGGDEFALILLGDKIEEIGLYVEKLKSNLRNFRFGDIEISTTFGYQIGNITEKDIYQIFSEADEIMYRKKIAKNNSIRNRTLNIIMQTLFEKNSREKLHSERVCYLSVEIGKLFNFDDFQQSNLRIASLMHDVGKIYVDNSILDKKGPLTDKEFEDVKKHSLVGFNILDSVPEYHDIARIIVQHHERNDGNGYPYGLKGEEISIEAKIISIADTFDAITSDRPYRKGKSNKEAIEELKRCSGTQFDPEVLDIAIEWLLFNLDV